MRVCVCRGTYNRGILGTDTTLYGGGGGGGLLGTGTNRKGGGGL